MSGWMGDNPFYLVLSFPDENVGIDLDEPQWHAKYEDCMRRPGLWTLVHKDTGAKVLAVRVNPGDQPYYTARHIGVVGSGGGNEITSYGIGKKCADGSTVRLWLLPDGTVCGGDDVDVLGRDIVIDLGPRP